MGGHRRRAQPGGRRQRHPPAAPAQSRADVAAIARECGPVQLAAGLLGSASVSLRRQNRAAPG
eukprot:4179384-Alexandrium_andersonii.AAC.1